MAGTVFISTVPFARYSDAPIKLLREAGINFLVNPLGRKLTSEELADFLSEVDPVAVIAGTETISDSVMDIAPSLRLISRVGIGLDSVDLKGARDRSIAVAYTPDAPSPAASELTIGLIIAGIRGVCTAHAGMKKGEWKRHFGRRIGNSVVGIVGLGRIGTGVLQHLKGFGCQEILVHDIREDLNIDGTFTVCGKEQLFSGSDLVTVHVPLTNKTRNLISAHELRMMKKSAFLVNTSRGGIVNEQDLEVGLRENWIEGAAVDVFQQEPYSGPLCNLPNCILTAHMGSMSLDCRAQMEFEATKAVTDFLREKPLESPVPEYEYEIQRSA